MTMIPTTALADTPKPCKEKIEEITKAADEAIEAQKKEIQLCKLGLSQVIDDNVALTQTVKERDEELSSFWRNPAIIIPLGIIVGGGAALYLTK